MVDLSKWAPTDSFTGLQAACLWCEVSPIAPTNGFLFDRSWSSNTHHCVSVVLGVLNKAAAAGELRGDTSLNPLALGGDHKSTVFSREELRRFAESVGQRPKFLFDTILPSSEPDVTAASPEAPKNKVGRPSKHDWDGFFAEIVRIADLDGLPAVQADLERQTLRWFEDTYGHAPSESDVRARIGPIYQRLRATGWQPR